MIRCAAIAIALLTTRVAVAAPGIHYLYFVRHAIYDRDPKATDDRVANGINALGHEQAKFLAARLAALPVKVHALYTSDFKRARDTATELADPLKLSPVVDPLLHECTPAPAANDPACEAQLTAAWAKYARPTPGGDTHDVLVSHGNAIRWLTARALGADQKVWTALDIANASLSIIAIAPDGSAYVVVYSDASHIPIVKQTWAGPSPGWVPQKK